jgi:hypothetical protein
VTKHLTSSSWEEALVAWLPPRPLAVPPRTSLSSIRSNHHLFQPLLYQVATSVLTPGQIGSPIRNILRNQRNTTVILGEVAGVDTEKKCVFVDGSDRSDVPISYDFLVLATGVTHSYFGHDEFAQHAPGLKTLADAVAIRNKILQAFEQAEAEEGPSRHRDLLSREHEDELIVPAREGTLRVLRAARDAKVLSTAPTNYSNFTHDPREWLPPRL